jgi:hypothetical protein
MDWKVSLDRYLTTPPEDCGFDSWYEDAVCNCISNIFYEKNKNWVEYDEQCDKWLTKLYEKGYSPKDAAKIIERAFYLYVK